MSEKGRRKKTEREIVYAMEIIAGFLLLAGFAAQLAVICARPVSGLWGPWLVGAALLGLQAGLTKTSRLRLCRSLWLAWLGLTLLLLPWLVSGLVACVNGLIQAWNVYEEDARNILANPLLTRFSYSIFFTVLMSGFAILIWTWRSHPGRMGLTVLLLMMPGLRLRCVSSWAMVLMLAGIAALWLQWVNAASVGKRWLWLGVISALLLTFIGKNQELMEMTRLRKDLFANLDTLRYGGDSLPQGDVWKADRLLSGEGATLTVTTEQLKTFYLRGYIGGRYEGGRWLALKKAAYAGSNEGMLKWLEMENFPVGAQSAATLRLDPDTPLQANRIEVANHGANRKYSYFPYSVEADTITGSVRSWLDMGYHANALLGFRHGEFVEWSGDQPGELLHAPDWIKAPQTDAQRQYIQAEAVYRSFVYQNYLDVDAETESLIRTLFLKEPMSSPGIYEAVTRIRDILEKQVQYAETPPQTPQSADPVRWFLSESRTGNAVQYASAAVMAFRVMGIPARYAEGYRLTREQISAGGIAELTAQDSHAWCEVYLDGLGWIPVDVTPGCYYDTFALLQMAEQPQDIEMTAALKDSEDPGELLDDLASQPTEPQTPLPSPVSGVLGAILLLCDFVLFLLIVLEVRRQLRISRWRRRWKDASARDEILCKLIGSLMKALAVPYQPGWKAELTAWRLNQKLPGIAEADILRAQALIEKLIYAQESLQPHEQRVLISVIEQIYTNRKSLTGKERLRLRYRIAL